MDERWEPGWILTEAGAECRAGQARLLLSFPLPGVARVRFWPEGVPPLRRSWDPVAQALDGAGEPCQLDGDGRAWGDGSIRVAIQEGALAFSDLQGRPFAVDLAPPGRREVALSDLGFKARPGDQLPPGPARSLVSLRKAIEPGEAFFGFGQRNLAMDRTGERLSHWNQDPPWGHHRSQDNLYQSHPTFLALRSGLAWGLLLHSSWFSRFDVEATAPGALGIETLGGVLEYFVLHGPDPAGVLDKLTRLTGRPFLPPLWSLGYHQSRWSYMDAEEVEQLVETFREKRLPLDVVHLDIDAMRGYRSFTWDPARFPEPALTLARLRGRGVRAVTIVDPGIKAELGAGYPVADEMALGGHFCRERSGAPFLGFCWPDEAMFPDFFQARTRAWWGGLHEGLLEAGVAGIWDDMNEPALFDQPFSSGLAGHTVMPLGLVHAPDHEPALHAEVHNLYGLMMARATLEGLQRLRPEERPWLLSRSGSPGIQACGAVWMGDNSSWWEHLQLSVPQLASMGLSGVPHVGVDIGGFNGSCSPELFARWIQLGVFYPFMRTHSVRDSARQEPWSFGPEVEEIAREALRLRYRLLPYLYTQAWAAHRTGAPILRPMLFDFPEDQEGWRRGDQFMFGPDLLVAPVLHPGHRHRLVWLPAGPWYDFYTGALHEGPLALAVEAPLARAPLFVRGGALLPLGNPRGSTDEPLTELTLEVFPGRGGEGAWVEDDGSSVAWRAGAQARTPCWVRVGSGRVEVGIEAREGDHRPHARGLRVRVRLPDRPLSVDLDGGPAPWTWDRPCAEVAWEDLGRPRRLVFEIPPGGGPPSLEAKASPPGTERPSGSTPPGGRPG